MNKRLLDVRKSLDFNQEKFGEKLGVTKTAISKMELGTYNITDTMIKLICSTYGVNEIWLRTGVGEMFAVTDVDDKFSWLVGKTLADNDVFTKRLLIYIMELDEAQKESLKGLAKVLLDEE